MAAEKKESIYKYADVECPICGHVFKCLCKGSDFKLADSDEIYHLSRCPKCMEDLFYPEKGGLGILPDLLRDDEIKITKFRF